ncbi:MAG: hypothetical protein Q9182_007509 [Xanthomendoza sp. 2 TL-2023]
MESVRCCANRLKGVKVYTKALWPVQMGSEWLIGNDHGWTYRSGILGNPEERQAFDREDNRSEGVVIHRKHTCAYFAALKQKHNLDASSIFKAAVTLFNTKTTGRQHAVFSNADRARRWPFLEKWITHQLSNPLSIAGPTLGGIINILQARDDETTLAFLICIQDD